MATRVTLNIRLVCRYCSNEGVVQIEDDEHPLLRHTSIIEETCPMCDPEGKEEEVPDQWYDFEGMPISSACH